MNQETKGFGRNDAELLVRVWNLFYQRTVAYAFDHPAAQETIPRVYEAVRKCLGQESSISFLFQEFGYYIGHVDIVYQPNNRKIADHLRRFGIESVTVNQPLTLSDFARFLDACSVTHADPTRFLAYLTNQGVFCFNVNNVSLQTVREGDSVVATGSPRPPGQSDAGGVQSGEARGERSAFDDAAMRVVLGHLTAQEMNANLSLLRVLESPSALPDAIMKATAGSQGNEANTLKQSLLNVVGAFKTEAGQGNVPIEDLLAGMYNMRTELLKAVKAQQGIAQHLSGPGGYGSQANGPGLGNADGSHSGGQGSSAHASAAAGSGAQQANKMADAADEIFVQTAAQLVMAEYKKCKGNPKRMAQVIQRIVPDRHHLQKVLNLFRSDLINQGVPLIEFFNLLSELNGILGTDQSYQEFIKAGSSLGISHDELLKELQENPQQAAQLIILASEARKSNKEGSAEDMIRNLADFVEKAGEAAGARMDTNPQEAVKLTSMLHQMEAQVNVELQGKGLSDELRTMGQQKLRMRMQRSITDLKGKAALAQLRDGRTTEAEKVHFLLEMFADEKELEDVMGQVKETLDPETVARDVGNQVMAKARQEMAARREKHMSKELPGGVYVKAVLDFFIKSEVSRALRYNLPFSALLVSFQGLPEDKAGHETHGDALRGLQNVLIGDLRKFLRDCDFVGYLTFNRFLVVLPMTTLEAAPRIIKKFQDNLNRQVALPNGTRLSIRPRCGLAAFDKQTTNSYPKIYAELVKSWQAAG
jgi:GGDEF domain-containing protein